MINIKEEAARLLSETISEIAYEDILDMLEYPPDTSMGDVALPCFKLSRILRQAPPQIANALAEKIAPSAFFEKPEPLSGYLNFKLSKAAFIENIVSDILEQGSRFGANRSGENKTIVIDYSSPNVAKRFHIGHLRSTMIGHALYRILEFNGYRCVGVNHLGDWGTQFGKQIVAYKNWGSKEAVEQGGIKELMRLYVKFHEESESNPALEEEARLWFVKMEQGDAEALALWRWIVDISLAEFKQLYTRLGVDFDYYTGESFYNDKMEAVVEELRQKQLMVESDGAQVVDLQAYNMPPSLILKSDGGTLYTTRDISAALYRKQVFDFDMCLYVTGVTQALHFKQWFKVVDLMGYSWAEGLHHIPFGTVSLEGMKLSSRKGQIVLLDEVINEAVGKTLETINQKNPNLPNKEQVAEAMGIGAIVFSDLSSGRIKDVTFSWDEILNFDGETGPYVQYTHARACSVLRKAGDAAASPALDGEKICSDEEFALVRSLYAFPEQVVQAAKDFEPSIIVRYLVHLAQAFNRFYHKHPILCDDAALKASRLALVKATQQTLQKGLWLIGVASPEQV